MSELGLLSELCPRNYSHSVDIFEMMMSFLTYLELQMSYAAVRHINRKKIIRRASLTYLDA
eukprot:349856-Pyramimonas_sp.AAC.1